MIHPPPTAPIDPDAQTSFRSWLRSRYSDSIHRWGGICEKRFNDMVRLWYPGEVWVRYEHLQARLQARIVEYPNGDRYEGDLIDGKRSGNGEMRFFRGKWLSYIGNWKNDAKHGKGVLNYADGWTYDGNFEDDCRHDLGKLYRCSPSRKITSDSSFHMRSFADSFGDIGSSILERLEEQWQKESWKKNDDLFGRGFGIYSFYKGMWNNDSKETGLGVSGCLERFVHFFDWDRKRYELTLGWLYEGEFLNGSRHGKGSYISHNGVKSFHYTGDWVMNKEHGDGKCAYDDGSSYEGEWQNGKKCGHGVGRNRFGDVYEGGWDNDRYHGEGILTNETKGERKAGEWHNGELFYGTMSSSTTKVNLQPKLNEHVQCPYPYYYHVQFSMKTSTLMPLFYLNIARFSSLEGFHSSCRHLQAAH